MEAPGGGLVARRGPRRAAVVETSRARFLGARAHYLARHLSFFFLYLQPSVRGAGDAIQPLKRRESTRTARAGARETVMLMSQSCGTSRAEHAHVREHGLELLEISTSLSLAH